MTADRVALIDWDESHVDVPDLDLALPHNAAGLDDDAHDIAAQASAAWEAAVCWDDEYRSQAARRSSSGLSTGHRTETRHQRRCRSRYSWVGWAMTTNSRRGRSGASRISSIVNPLRSSDAVISSRSRNRSVECDVTTSPLSRNRNV